MNMAEFLEFVNTWRFSIGVSVGLAIGYLHWLCSLWREHRVKCQRIQRGERNDA